MDNALLFSDSLSVRLILTLLPLRLIYDLSNWFVNINPIFISLAEMFRPFFAPARNLNVRFGKNQWVPVVINFFTFFTFFGKEGSFQIPDLASPDFYKAYFLTFRPESGLAGRPASPDLDSVPDFFHVSSRFSMYSRA
jgi:hypothetical protein